MIRHVHALRRARRAAHARLKGLPHVVGTGLGVKRVRKDHLRTPAVIVFVSDKQPRDALNAEALIPERVIDKNGQMIATDVVQLDRPVRQLTGPPYFCLDDGNHQGTVTALARLRGQPGAFAVSCAHCVEGAKQDLSQSCQMALWDAARNAYDPVGLSEPPFYGQTGGNGQPGDFGFSDWGMFSVQEPSVAQRAMTSPLLSCGPLMGNLPVWGRAAAGRDLHGVINAIEIDAYGWRIDVMVSCVGPPTAPGDSGLLWRASNGQGIAMHAAFASNNSLCMAARRLQNTLDAAGIDLVDPDT